MCGPSAVTVHGAPAGFSNVAERLIEANGVELCTEAYGDPTDSPILLIMGIGASMLWWEDDFRRLLADSGRFVVRYAHRDTRRSVTYEAGRPGYTGADLVADSEGVLRAYNIPAAHIVGVSAGGAFAQLLALDSPSASFRLSSLAPPPLYRSSASRQGQPRRSGGSCQTPSLTGLTPTR
jgi:pimeloyl-ACP methyl ester carboxylesterase